MSQWGSVSSLVKDVQTRKRTAKELVQQSLKTIKENEDYKAIIATTEVRALKRADEIDRQIAQGEDAGRLAGTDADERGHRGFSYGEYSSARHASGCVSFDITVAPTLAIPTS